MVIEQHRGNMEGDVVVGRNLSYAIVMTNLGDLPATNVVATLPNFPKHDFDLISGDMNAQVAEIAVGDRYVYMDIDIDTIVVVVIVAHS